MTQEFDYMLLGRLQTDCEYVIKTSPSEKHLWAGNVPDQIAKMKELWQGLEEKPEWLSWEQILQYEQQLSTLLMGAEPPLNGEPSCTTQHSNESEPPTRN